MGGNCYKWGERMLKTKNKKAVFYSVTILIFTIFILIVALVALIKKSDVGKKVGEEQIELIKKYQAGESIFFFIDQVSRYSPYIAIYPFAKNGTYFNKPECGYYLKDNEEYTLWENFTKDATNAPMETICYPTKGEITKNFGLFLQQVLDGYLQMYPFDRYSQECLNSQLYIKKLVCPYLNNYASIPTNGYDFSLEDRNKSVLIEGVAIKSITNPINRYAYREQVMPTLSEREQDCLAQQKHNVFFRRENKRGVYDYCGRCTTDYNCDNYVSEIYCNLDPCDSGCIWKEDSCENITTLYSIRPSFRTEIDYNFISNFSDYVNKAKEIKDNIKNCLIKGSGKPDDFDIVTCSDINKLKGEIQGLEKYDINYGDAEDGYLLLFNIIEDDSFGNIYSQEKLVTKFGIKFRDSFAPPATEIIGIETRDSEKYLRWEVNNASDIISYNVYYKKIEVGIGGVRTQKPDSVNRMDNGLPTVSALLVGPGPDFYFYENDKPELKLDLPSGDYYFYVIAIDYAGNSQNGEGIGPVELSI